MKLYPNPPASQIAIECSQYALMPAQKVSVEMAGTVESRGGVVEKRMLPDVSGVAGKAFTTTDVMMPKVPKGVSDRDQGVMRIYTHPHHRL